MSPILTLAISNNTILLTYQELHFNLTVDFLFVLRNLRQEGFNQKEIDRLLYSLVLPKITYNLSVYGSSPTELNTVQRFLTRCFKRKYCFTQLCIYNLLEKSDKIIFQKFRKLPNRPLKALMLKIVRKSLEKNQSQWPKVNTERFKQAFVNRLIFKYNSCQSN